MDNPEHHNITFKKVDTPETRQLFRDMLCMVAKNLDNTGRHLWNVTDLTDKKLFSGFPAFICFVDDVPAGTMILATKDHQFWWNITTDDSYFVTKFSVMKEFRGKGISFAMLTYAKKMATLDKKSFLRLNCRYERKHLCRVYEKFGFTLYGLAYLFDRTNALFEIKI